MSICPRVGGLAISGSTRRDEIGLAQRELAAMQQDLRGATLDIEFDEALSQGLGLGAARLGRPHDRVARRDAVQYALQPMVGPDAVVGLMVVMGWGPPR